MEDTIVAVSTPVGYGGISIVRISGNKAFKLADILYGGKENFSKKKSHTVIYGKVLDPVSRLPIEEALFIKMDSPKTYTTEDTVEINCHGGITQPERVLAAVLLAGKKCGINVRLANPGEFTKRAFLNGRIDLAQAESVLDLINSKTEKMAQMAFKQIKGELSEKIDEITEGLTDILAAIDAESDFSEDGIESTDSFAIVDNVSKMLIKLSKLIKTFEKGKITREGVTVTIAGFPNSGKSSLMNEVTGKYKSIVTDIPGTTRDIIEERIIIDKIAVKFQDTAGLRITGDIIEKIGIDLSIEEIKKSDLVILLYDGSIPYMEDFGTINPYFDKIDNNIVFPVLNKIDIIDKKKDALFCQKFKDIDTCRLSVLTGEGIDNFFSGLSKKLRLDKINSSEEIMITSLRHYELLKNAEESLKNALDGLADNIPLEFCYVDIKAAASFTSEITGKNVSSEVFDKIFSKFCIGK